jgi:hypothetical protein
MASVGEMRAMLRSAATHLGYAVTNTEQGPSQMGINLTALTQQLRHKVEEGLILSIQVAIPLYAEAEALMKGCDDQAAEIFPFMAAIQGQMEDGYRDLTTAAMSGNEYLNGALREVSVANELLQEGDGKLLVIKSATEGLPTLPHTMVPENARTLFNDGIQFVGISVRVKEALMLAVGYIETYEATL